MNPQDPITEIIKSGQAFSTAVALERTLWVIIGLFFVGAITSSILKGAKQNYLFSNKSFLARNKLTKQKKITDNISDLK